MKKRKFDSLDYLCQAVDEEIKNEFVKFNQLLQDITEQKVVECRLARFQKDQYNEKLFQLNLDSCDIPLRTSYEAYKTMLVCIKRSQHSIYYNIYKALYNNPNIYQLDNLLSKGQKDALLHMAARDWNTPMAKHLLEVGADARSVINQNILHHIVVRMIYAKGPMVDPNYKKLYKTHTTAGQHIVRELVDLLLSNGASVTYTPGNLYDEILSQCFTSVGPKDLANVPVNYHNILTANHNRSWFLHTGQSKRFGNNPLLISVFHSYKDSSFKILKEQLKQNVKFDTITDDGMNILQFFIWRNTNYRFVATFLEGLNREEAEQQVKYINRSGSTALNSAVTFARKTKLIELLIKYGADVNHQEQPLMHSNTPAYFAILKHRAGNLDCLLKHGAKLDVSCYREFIDMRYDTDPKKELVAITKVLLKHKIKVPEGILLQSQKMYKAHTVDYNLIATLQFQLDVYLDTYCQGFVHNDVILKAKSFIDDETVRLSEEVLHHYNPVLDSLFEKKAILSFLCCIKKLQKALTHQIPRMIQYKILYSILDHNLTNLLSAVEEAPREPIYSNL